MDEESDAMIRCASSNQKTEFQLLKGEWMVRKRRPKATEAEFLQFLMNVFKRNYLKR